MVCIHCLHSKTQVINSRNNSRAPQTWRRRRCLKCQKVFTTYERVAANDEIKLQNPSGALESYNFGQLLLDIAICFDHDPAKRAGKAYWLAQTVENKLLISGESVVTTESLAKIVHHTMFAFDRLAAIQFAARHHKFNLL